MAQPSGSYNTKHYLRLFWLAYCYLFSDISPRTVNTVPVFPIIPLVRNENARTLAVSEIVDMFCPRSTCE